MEPWPGNGADPPKLPDHDSTALSDRVRWAISGAGWRAVAALAVAGILVAWWLGARHGDAPTPAQVVAVGSAPGAPTSAPVPTPGGAGLPSTAVALPGSNGIITVDVVGPVRRPGVVRLPMGSRVMDAIAAAGGLSSRRRGPRLGLNLARPLVDGEQVDARGPSAPDGSGSGSAGRNAAPPGTPGTPGKVNLNRASVAELDSLPRVGPVTAQKIIDFRAAHGGFRTVDQLRDIAGIGDRTFEQLAPLVTVS